MVQYMRTNIEEYSWMDEVTLNGDLPPRIRYVTVADRIDGMAESHAMIGELEISAIGKVLQRPIVILDEHLQTMVKFGEDIFPNNETILMKFQPLENDAGHYSAVIHLEIAQGEQTDTVTTENKSTDNNVTHTARENEEMAICDMIKIFSPTPKAKKTRTRKRKIESAAIITSSPYKKVLEDKISHTHKKSSNKKKRCVARRGTKINQKKLDRTVEDTYPCLICTELFSNSNAGEVWVQCQVCLNWAHEACTAGNLHFICPFCE